MEYSYIAVTDTGIRRQGIIDATSDKEIANFLKKNNLIPISIKRKNNSDIISSLPFQGISNTDIVIFTRQLASMILTGLTLVESLNVLKKQVTNAKMEALIDDLIANLSEGKSFSDALSRHKDVFTEVYISLIKAAEAGGIIDKIMERLAENLEKSEELKKSIKSALFYPVIILLGVVGVIVIMNLMVIPNLTELYKGLNVELPVITQLVLAMSDFFTNYILIIFVATVIAVLLFSRFSKTEQGKRIIDKLLLKLPVFSNIVILAAIIQISRTLSLLIRSGASIIEALHISANVSGNLWYKDAVNSTADLVEKGFNLSTALENQDIFPPILIQMVKVGEETGKIDDSLEKVSEYFERDLNIKVKTLTTAMEPMLIAFLGGTVGFLIISVMLPIYSIMSEIK